MALARDRCRHEASPVLACRTRDGDAAMEFIDDLASRLANLVQLTTDGHKAYLYAMDAAFGGEVDFAQLVKLYGSGAGERQGPLQPRRMHGDHQDARHRRPGHEARQHVLCRTEQSQHSDALPPDDEADERLLKEDGKPRARDGAPFPLLQFRPYP